MKFDDVKLLNEIRKNSRSSLTALAYKTDMPLSTVFKKVVRLENSGVISRNTALIDFEKIGHPFVIADLKSYQNHRFKYYHYFNKT